MAAAALTLAGCASGPRLYVNPQADMTYYHRIAVLPFSNLSNDRFAGERVSRAFVTELIIADRFEIVDPAEFRANLERSGAEPDRMGDYDPSKFKQVAEAMQATGVLRGAVTEYQMQRSGGGEFPVLAMEAELVDVATSKVVWRIAISEKGKGRFPIFGGGGVRTLAQLTQNACRDAVAKLRGKAF